MQSSTKSNSINPIDKLLKFNLALWLPMQWHTISFWHLLLTPLSWLFFVIISIRKLLYQYGIIKSFALSVPVVIVGNINVGGTGKTPLVIYLIEQFRKVGLSPGVISRGFGAKNKNVKAVLFDSLASEVGDEPLLLKRRLNCPVYIHQDRVLAGQALLAENQQCDIIISDDGLQHYRLKRDIEISVVDATLGYGNGALLPAGPLREPISRLNSVDFIVVNGSLNSQYAFNKWHGNKIHEMQIAAQYFYNLQDPSIKCKAEDFVGDKMIALAGIGNPSRFFNQLSLMNLHFKKHTFPDHYAFDAQDFVGMNADVIIMTEKDAVKCQSFAQSHFWVLPINAQLEDNFMECLIEKLESIDDEE